MVVWSSLPKMVKLTRVCSEALNYLEKISQIQKSSHLMSFTIGLNLSYKTMKMSRLKIVWFLNYSHFRVQIIKIFMPDFFDNPFDSLWLSSYGVLCWGVLRSGWLVKACSCLWFLFIAFIHNKKNKNHSLFWWNLFSRFSCILLVFAIFFLWNLAVHILSVDAGLKRLTWHLRVKLPAWNYSLDFVRGNQPIIRM